VRTDDYGLRADVDDPKKLVPHMYDGIKAMSYGFVAKGQRAIMRGPMVSQLITQLIKSTDWGDLDFLVIDMPPGTGDIALTLCQEININGALIVTTPQKLSYVDVIKGIEMFDNLKVPTIGILENMSYFI
jgi:Mrp family chromosome partitioning ATPase